MTAPSTRYSVLLPAVIIHLSIGLSLVTATLVALIRYRSSPIVRSRSQILWPLGNFGMAIYGPFLVLAFMQDTPELYVISDCGVSLFFSIVVTRCIRLSNLMRMSAQKIQARNRKSSSPGLPVIGSASVDQTWLKRMTSDTVTVLLFVLIGGCFLTIDVLGYLFVAPTPVEVCLFTLRYFSCACVLGYYGIILGRTGDAFRQTFEIKILSAVGLCVALTDLLAYDESLFEVAGFISLLSISGVAISSGFYPTFAARQDVESSKLQAAKVESSLLSNVFQELEQQASSLTDNEAPDGPFAGDPRPAAAAGSGSRNSMSGRQRRQSTFGGPSTGASREFSLEWILETGDFALSCFEAFLQKEFSVENVFFLMDLRSLAAATTPRDKADLTERMIRKYFSSDSIFELNLPSDISAPVRDVLLLKVLMRAEDLEKEPVGAVEDQPDLFMELFQHARDHVFRTLQFDNYRRFTKSPYFTQMKASYAAAAAAAAATTTRPATMGSARF